MMDFNEYINNLNELDRQEIKGKIESIYILNKTTLMFFEDVHKTMLNILNQSIIDPSLIKELETNIPLLISLKKEINALDTNIASNTNIAQAIYYIKNEMSIPEIKDVSKSFFELKEKIILEEEQQKKSAQTKAAEEERKRRELEEQQKKIAQAKAEEEERKRRELEDAEKRKQFQILFEYKCSFGASQLPAEIFIDDVRVATIQPNQHNKTFSHTAIRGSHRITVKYEKIPLFWQIFGLVLFPLFILLFNAITKKLSIQFDINLNKNTKVVLNRKNSGSGDIIKYSVN